MIKQESINKLLEVVDIVEIVREYLPNLKRVGKNYFVLCPFHSEKTPSFSISPDKNLIHCFGCGYTANIFKFVQDIEHINFYEAVEKIAKKYNFTLEYVDEEQQRVLKEKYDEIRFLTEVLTDIAEVYHDILLNSELASDARKYLVSRGLKIETLRIFKIGYAPAGNYISKEYKSIPVLSQKGYDLSTLYKAGIVNFPAELKQSQRFDHPYDWFRNRIMFPIFNLNGKVVGFGGRILPGSVSDFENGEEEPPVYLNSPETVVFNKRSVLYGIYQAKEFITKQQYVCVVEGYMDVLLLYQEGIKNVVAPLGTALTEQQVRLLKRYCDKVYLLFDPDTAGVEATISASKTVFSCGLYPEVVELDDNKDPDEYILYHGLDKMLQQIKNPVSVVKYVVKYYSKDKPKISVTEKLSILRKMMEIVENISNPIVKSEFIKELSEELKLDEQVIRGELKRKRNVNFAGSLMETVFNRPYTCEEELLWICIHYPEVIEEIPEEVFSHDEVYLSIFKLLKEQSVLKYDTTDLIQNLPQEGKDIFMRLVFDEKKMVTTMSLEERIKSLFLEIYKVKMKKRYKELKPIIDEMLEGKISFNPQLMNEYKQLLETLKLNRR